MKHILLLLSLLGGAANASTIVAVDGTQGGGLVVISTIFAVSWTMPQAAQNVNIYATIYGATDSSYLNVSLANGTGPGTVALQAKQIAIPDFGPAESLLFSNLTLQPGTYYLAFQGRNAEVMLTGVPTFTLGLGATLNSDLYTNAANGGNFANLSASTFRPDPDDNGLFRVTGDAVPEPATIGMAGLVLIAIGVRAHLAKR